MLNHGTEPHHLHRHKGGTHPLIWFAAIICVIFAIGLIVSGVVVFVGYLVIRPRVPTVSVTQARLDAFDYSQAGVLSARLTVVIRAENDNRKAHSSFSDFKFVLYFHGLQVARLVNLPFNVGKNSTVDFNYEVESTSIPLDPEMMNVADASLKQNRVTFDLKGHARARWRVGPLGSVKFWCNLNCRLQFPAYGDAFDISHCTSKTK